MFDNIPKSRLVIYLLLIGFIPFILVLFNFMAKRSAILAIEQTLESTKEQVVISKKTQAVNNAVIEHFRQGDRFYIDKQLETLTFLKPEIENLERIVANKAFAGDETIDNRLAFLKGPENQMLFSEGVVQSYPLFQETVDSLVHPVEVNVNDIKEILARVEGVRESSLNSGESPPQLIITDFDLIKKGESEGNKVFLLNMKILKREYQ